MFSTLLEKMGRKRPLSKCKFLLSVPLLQEQLVLVLCSSWVIRLQHLAFSKILQVVFFNKYSVILGSLEILNADIGIDWLFWFSFGSIFRSHIFVYSLKRKLKNWRKPTWLKNHGRCLERQVVIYDQLTACLKKMSALTTPLLLVKNIHFIMELNSRSKSKWC